MFNRIAYALRLGNGVDPNEIQFDLEFLPGSVNGARDIATIRVGDRWVCTLARNGAAGQLWICNGRRASGIGEARSSASYFDGVPSDRALFGSG